jgi:hypothetical protein
MASPDTADFIEASNETLDASIVTNVISILSFNL